MQWVVCLVLFWAAAAPGQVSDLGVSVQPADIGIGGIVRPGTWTPMRVTLENRSASSRNVRCQWLLADIDGDRIQVHRSLALTPQRTQQLWLYAVPAYNMDNRPDWRVQVIDEDSGELLATQRLTLGTRLEPRVNMIGVTSPLALDLRRFADDLTQHEEIRFIRGLNPAALPDRWYGLSGLQALIWTPDTADPGDPTVMPGTLKAIREWVDRGGHLVAVLPSNDAPSWVESPLADMLPAVRISKVADVHMPAALGNPKDPILIDMQVLEPQGDTSVVLADADDRPWVVAGQYGFGRVTLIGVELTARQLSSRKMPDAPDLWRAVFGWRNKALPKDKEEARRQGTMRSERREMGRIVRPTIAMRDTFTGALMLAIVVFGVYWLVAGPLGFAVLRQRGMAEHSWVVFVALVAVFSAICWGGATLLRPRQNRVAHFTVLDVDATTGRVHVHSWLSAFVARHGRVHIAIDPKRTQSNRNTLVSAGLPGSKTEAVFLDPQRYDLAAAAPYGAQVPYRATAKQFELDFIGPPGSTGTGRSDDDRWIMPQAFPLRIVNGFPEGQVSHRLPGTLKDVLVVYCPGGGAEPVVAQQGPWTEETRYPIRRPKDPKNSVLAVYDVRDLKNRWKGYLANRIKTNKPSGLDDYEPDRRVPLAGNQIIAPTEILTFFSTLPPPRYWDDTWETVRYTRALGREFDLTALLKLRRVIIIGYLEDAPLPVPLTINGRECEGSGWVMVRWISPIP